MARPRSSLVKTVDKEVFKDQESVSRHAQGLSLESAAQGVPSSSEDHLDESLPENLSAVTLSSESKTTSSNFVDDIARTCRDLVDETVKRSEIQETRSASEKPMKNKKLQPTCTPKPNIHRGLSLAEWDDEEEEECDEIEEDEQKQQQEYTSRHYQHIELIKKLRLQLKDLEKYAYERGELDHIPASVLAERQTVILETLKERLSLKIGLDEVGKLEIEELKKQIDQEINGLVDPLTTKEHLLGQLKTQLRDLERYITHLHRAIGKGRDRDFCACRLHGCSALTDHNPNEKVIEDSAEEQDDNSLIDTGTLPKTTRLIRSIVTQLICSDAKLRERTQQADHLSAEIPPTDTSSSISRSQVANTITKAPQYHDSAVWSIHIDRVVLATDSLTNLHSKDFLPHKGNENLPTVDKSLVESVVRRQLVPAIRDLLTYGLIDTSRLPKPSSYTSLFLDPLQILTSLTCLPQSRSSNSELPVEKIHVWDIIVDYYSTKNETSFKTSSIKTLSQSFNLAPTMSGPIKVTSKQALLIAVENILETLSKCKPNGPESHFKYFIYTALNWSKLSTWLRLVFKNKSMVRKYYHPFSFVNQPEKIDRFFATLEVLNKIEFKLEHGSELQSVEKIVSAF